MDDEVGAPILEHHRLTCSNLGESNGCGFAVANAMQASSEGFTAPSEFPMGSVTVVTSDVDVESAPLMRSYFNQPPVKSGVTVSKYSVISCASASV